MIEIQSLRDNKEELVTRLKIKNVQNASEEVEHILTLDGEKRKVLGKLETLRHELNQVSKTVGQLMGQGKKEDAELAKLKTKKAKEDVRFFEESLERLEKELYSMMVNLPNPAQLRVPRGNSEADNEVIEEGGTAPSFSFTPKPHWELCKTLDIVDWELGAKITGAGFPVYKGKGAKLQRALISFFLDEAEKAGYAEVQPPLLINEASAFGTGQLPDKEGQMYHVSLDELYLIPTAEVPITNIYRNVIIKENELPVKKCGYTPCFRREAGSYGKDVRGLNRLHQFDKVEIVRIVRPDESDQHLDEMVAYVKGLLGKLGLQHRVLRLCGGDLGFAAAITIDMEVYSAAQERWLEVSSVSNFETFQSNRLKLRYKDSSRKSRLAHTLNGSALALPRIFASIIENYQHSDGSVSIPEVLRPYTKFDKIVQP